MEHTDGTCETSSSCTDGLNDRIQRLGGESAVRVHAAFTPQRYSCHTVQENLHRLTGHATNAKVIDHSIEEVFQVWEEIKVYFDRKWNDLLEGRYLAV